VSKKRIVSIDKGKRGERDLAKYLRQFVGPDGKRVEAERGQQHRGGGDSPDVRHSIPGLHFEVKRSERMTLWSAELRHALQQAKRDALSNCKPCVVWRHNRKPWLITGERYAKKYGGPVLATAVLDEYLVALGYKKAPLVRNETNL